MSLQIDQATWDAMVNQISALTTEISSLKSNPPVSIADKIRLPMPNKFRGERDGDTVRNFTQQLQNWFDLVQLTNANQQARFAHTLLDGPALDWFEAQNFDMSQLHWPTLCADLLY